MTATGSCERRLILHQDDVGMSHGANIAFEELSKFGTCSSGSVMVPCPWFLEAAEIAARVPGIDLGVHLTLTSEKSFYRWRPVTSVGMSGGLTDHQGFFWRDVPSLRKNANLHAVESELRGQIELAYRAGIDVTHLDAHMGAALAPEFCEIYLKLGIEFGLPILATRHLADYGPKHNLGNINASYFDAFSARAAQAGVLLIDEVLETAWEELTDISQTYRQMITGSTGELTFFSLHFNAPGDIEVIDPTIQAQARTAEYELFGSGEFRSWLNSVEREVVGFRDLRNSLRASLAQENTMEAAR